MKILQLHNHYVQPGGEDTISDAEAELLRRAGHEVACVRVRNPASGLRAARALAVSPYNPAQERAIRRRLRRDRPDVAHVHNTWFALTPSVLRGLHREHVPIVMTLQNFRPLCAEAKLFRDGRTCTDCVGSHPWHAARHGCYRGSVAASIPAAATIALARRMQTWERVERFLAPSEFVKSIFVTGGFDPDQIIVRPNFVEDPGPRPIAPERSRQVLYVGRVSPEKGVDVLLEAWRRATGELGGLELTVIGDGPARAALERTAPPNVTFAGYVDPGKVPTLLLSARALVFPTLWSENFGRSIIEAMAAGLPVLASRIGTPAEIVGGLGDRWLAAPSDVEGWSDALRRLADDDAVASGGARARAQWERRYGPDQGLRSLLGAYRAAIAAGSGTGPI